MNILFTVTSRLGKKPSKQHQIISVFVPIYAAHLQWKKLCSTLNRRLPQKNYLRNVLTEEQGGLFLLSQLLTGAVINFCGLHQYKERLNCTLYCSVSNSI